MAEHVSGMNSGTGKGRAASEKGKLRPTVAMLSDPHYVTQWHEPTVGLSDELHRYYADRLMRRMVDMLPLVAHG